MTVTDAAMATVKFVFGTCNCVLNHGVGTGYLSLVLGSLHVCGHAQVRSHLSPDIDCAKLISIIFSLPASHGCRKASGRTESEISNGH